MGNNWTKEDGDFQPIEGERGNRKYQREGVGGGEQGHRDGAPGRDYRSPGVGASPAPLAHILDYHHPETLRGPLRGAREIVGV